MSDVFDEVAKDVPKATPAQSAKPQGDIFDQIAKEPLKPAAKDEPGFLDKEIPLSSYGNATLSGLQSIGRGLRDAATGIIHPIESAKGVLAIPSQVKQVPAAIRDINASPDPMGTYAKVGQETAGQGAGQALTALATEGVARGVGAVPKEVTTAPVRLASRSAEGIVNSAPMRYIRGATRLFTPADEARKVIRIPGRDLGLEGPVYPGANLPIP